MMSRIFPADRFPGYEVFSADLEEGHSCIPRLRLVLKLKEVHHSGPLPVLPESFLKPSAEPATDPWLGQPVDFLFAFEPDNPQTQKCRIPQPRDSFQGVITGY